MRSEAAAFWRSVRGAQLLLAGSFSRADSDALVDGVRRTLLPMLPPPPAGAPAASAGTGEAEPLVRSEVLAEWGHKPSYTPRPLANNLCLVPALGATLDQTVRLADRRVAWCRALWTWVLRGVA